MVRNWQRCRLVVQGVSRANGINFDDEQVADVTNTKPVTLYFMAQNNNKQQYYVPVTCVAEGKENDYRQL